MLRRLLFVCIILVAAAAEAQYPRADSYPIVEGFAGFSTVSNEYSLAERYNSPGFHASFAFNPRARLRLVTDFGAQFHGTDLWYFRRVSLHDYQIMFGPEFAYRQRRFTPFVRGLAGLALRHYVVPTGTYSYDYNSGTTQEDKMTVASAKGFAFGGGGGLDWNLRIPLLAIRLFQFDFVRAHLAHDRPEFSPIQDQLPLLPGWQNNYRFACGVVFKLGEADSIPRRRP